VYKKSFPKMFKVTQC